MQVYVVCLSVFTLSRRKNNQSIKQTNKQTLSIPSLPKKKKKPNKNWMHDLP